MAKKIEGDDYAYPGENYRDTLTKRELFAAMAMQGILSNHSLSQVTNADISRVSTGLADALIEALNK